MELKLPKKKICCVIHSLRSGGSERNMSDLINFFSLKENIEVHLVLYGIKREIFYAINHEKIIIHKPDFEFNNNRRFWHTIKTLFFLRKLIKQIKPFSVLSFCEIWNNLVLLSLFGLRYPVYVADHSSPTKNLGVFHNKLRKLLYKKTAGIICQTEISKEITSKRVKHNNIKVIGNPLSNSFKRDEIKQENIILSVGRLIKTKHFDELINIFAETNHKDWKLVIVGGDSLKQNLLESLKKQIKDLNMEDKIFLEGAQSDIYKYYSSSKIFAFTSSSEGFPNVILEALSAGLPVVAYDCVAGPSDIINDTENGFLIPLFDKQKFKEKLQLLMDNDDLRKVMAEKAPFSVEKFNISNICERFYNFITEIKS